MMGLIHETYDEINVIFCYVLKTCACYLLLTTFLSHLT